MERKEEDVREGARRTVVLAREGLDMLSQVRGVLEGTVGAAEEWLLKLGEGEKLAREERAQGDTEMGGMGEEKMMGGGMGGMGAMGAERRMGEAR